MTRMKNFVMTTLLGGLVVILPMTLLIFALTWLFGFVTDLIQPLTDVIVAQAEIKELLADLIVVAIVLAICFFVGLLVRTRLGVWFFHRLDEELLLNIPGYKMIKETVQQFLGNKASPFSSVALVNIYGNETLMTAFVTDEHEDGSFTVFVPTGPNPTSGNIFHLRKEQVHPVDVPVEDAMRSINSCGAGARILLKHRKDSNEA